MAAALAEGRLPPDLPGLNSPLGLSTQDIRDAVELIQTYGRSAGRGLETPDGENRVGDKVDTGRWLAESIGIPLERIADDLLPANLSDEGARRMRALGRLAILQRLADVQNTISAAYGEASSADSGKPARVILLSSLAGGSGAGMAIDVALMLRRILPKGVRISGHFLMPSVFEAKAADRRLKLNAYSMLRELAQIAQPNNRTALTVIHRVASAENRITLVKGDPAQFDDVYLYGRESWALDWEPPGRTADDSVASACRAMADGAMSLLRRDLAEAKTGRQNSISGSALGQDFRRRVFHSVSVTPLRPLDVAEFGDMLFNELGEIMVRPAFAPTADSDIPREERMARRLVDDTLAELDKADQAASRQVSAGSAWRDDATLLGAVWNDQAFDDAFRDTDRSFASCAPAETGEPECVVATRKALDALQLRDILRPMVERLVTWHAGGTMDDSRELKCQVDATGLFSEQIEAVLGEIDGAIADIGALDTASARAGRRLCKDLIAKLDRYSADQTGPASAPPTSLTISLDDAALFENRQLLQAALGIGDREAAIRNIAVWKYAPDNRAQIHAVAEWAVGAVRRAFRDAASSQTERFIALRTAFQSADYTDRRVGWRNALDNHIIRFDQIEANRDEFGGAFDGAFDATSRHDPETLRARARFNLALDPLTTIVAALAPQAEGADRRTTSHVDRIALRLRREKLADAYAERVLRGGSRIMGDRLGRIDGLLNFFHQRFDEIGARTRPDYDLLEAMARAIDDFESSDRDAASASPLGTLRSPDLLNPEFDPAKVNRLLEAARDHCHRFVELIFAQPEMSLSRLGGKAGLSASANFVKASPFKGEGVPGGDLARFVTLALPVPDAEFGATRVGVDPQSAPRDIIEETLSFRVDPTPLPSHMPVLMLERRNHAAHEIEEIEALRQAYDEAGDAERVMSHALPEGARFPHLVAATFVGHRRAQWLCVDADHPQDFVNHPDAEFCSLCLEEYRAGRRPLQAVAARPDLRPLRAVPHAFKIGEIDPDLRLTGADAEHFDNGVPGAQFDDAMWRALTDRLKDEKLNGRRWDPHAPPLLRAPQAPRRDGRSLESVARMGGPGTPFLRGVLGDPLHECFHCGFPIATELDPATGTASAACPRCRRELHRCDGCTSNLGVYVEAAALSSAPASRVCLRCDGEIAP
ncbi:MAG: tubulin-like doman-containing protein [Pseudomonadota bacterium]|nr:tubulin-like doman-containing protein [Pseudomonadota bacterium]